MAIFLLTVLFLTRPYYATGKIGKKEPGAIEDSENICRPMRGRYHLRLALALGTEQEYTKLPAPRIPPLGASWLATL